MSDSFCSALGPAITDYLALKRALGRRYGTEGWVLGHFDRFLAARAATAVTPEVYAAWCLSISHLASNTRRQRMWIVRKLCLYLRRRDATCFLPDPGGFPAFRAHSRPHIFTEEEVARVLCAASELLPRSTSPLCGPMYRLAVVLLYTAGLRRGELVRLVLSDYDPVERTLHVRASKFHKSRLVALSADAAREMETYLQARRALPCSEQAPLLVSNSRGLRARSGTGLGGGLRRLFVRAAVRTDRGRPPRVHDLRHTHAVHVLLRWYRAGVSPQAKLPALAASMGHVSVASTAHYLALVEPVAEAATDLFARHCRATLPSLGQEGGGR
jgi:integrase/recombinase XerD